MDPSVKGSSFPLFHLKMEADTASEKQLSFPSGMMGNA
jgi:hypothetical protein